MKKIILLVLFLFSLQISYSQPNWTPIWKDLNVNSCESSVVGMQALDSLDFILYVWYQGYCKLASSKDGAKTWEIIYDETFHNGDPFDEFPAIVNSMVYPYKDFIFLAFDNGQIRRSRNRGMTFDTVFFPAKGPCYNLVMADTSNGIVFQEFNEKIDPDFYHKYLYVTTDGWNTYTAINIDTINGNAVNVRGIHFKSPDTFAFLSTRSDVAAMYYSTTDKCKTWDEFNLSNLINGVKNCYLSSLYFLNDSLGWISAMEYNNVGDQSIDVIFKTTNGGKTWELNYRQENYPIFGLENIVFYDENNGIAVGQWGKILRTTDGGVNWIQEYLKNAVGTIEQPTSANVCYIGSKPIIGTGHSINILWQREEESSVNDTKTENDLLNIYPNPINKNQKFNIEFKTLRTMQNIIVKITDLRGKELSNFEFREPTNPLKAEVQLPNCFSTGTYVIYIESDGKILSKSKLFVE